MLSEETKRKKVLERALLQIRELKARVAELQAERSPAIAVVGMACRFPGGVSSAEDYWKLLRDGRDAVCEIPQDRWDVDAHFDSDPEAPGKMYTRRGGFLQHDIHALDHRLFGIAPRDAQKMDPQHRIFLEVAWQALEHAGQAADRLAGSRTGVYLGITSSEHALLAARDIAQIDPYDLSGTPHNFAVGRLSYLLGLRGPSLAVDTACSSSLVAVHLACQSLRTGEVEMALAGGVNLLLTPHTYIGTSKARMLSARGRCATFDADADGMTRGEGCGVVVLKRLDQAVAGGDDVLAVIAGSAVNQDGASAGLTVPSMAAQRDLIRDALRMAALDPHEVSYVEAHGTGTPLGDPIEVAALTEALCQGRGEERPLLLGSAKANLGHLESASGMAGLIKAVLAVRHGSIPAQLHFKTPNPHIAWHPSVRVPVEATSWPRTERIAGVSGFGASGTNAHVVVVAAPEIARDLQPAEAQPSLFVLSAASAAALTAKCALHARHLRAHPEAELRDVCYTAGARRSHHEYRLALVVDSCRQLRDELERIERGEPSAAVHRGKHPRGQRPRLAFAFTGQGAQYHGAGRSLYQGDPRFRQLVDRCLAIVDPLLPAPLSEVWLGERDDPRVHQTVFAQPLLFILELALAHRLKDTGLTAELLIGHSIGELSAAALSGVMTLEDALRVVVARATAMQALPEGGAMLSVGAGEQEVRSALAGSEQRVAIAAVNGARQVVISGDEDAVLAAGSALQAAGHRTRRLKVSHAFHSHRMDPMLDAFAGALGTVAFARPAVPIVSNLTGKLAGAELQTADYWRRHVRATVRFADGVRTLNEQRVKLIVEVGPHPVLMAAAGDDLPEGVHWVPTLRREGDARVQLLDALARLYVLGADFDPGRFARDGGGRVTALPTYPFEHETRAGRPDLHRELAFLPVERLPPPARRAHGGVHLVLAPEDSELGRAVAGCLLGLGGRVLRQPADGGELAALLREHAVGASELHSVLYLGEHAGPETDETLAPLRARCAPLLPLLQQLSALSGFEGKLWIGTARAQATGDGQAVVPAAAALWGLGRVIGLEHAALWGGLIDVEGQDAASDARAICEELLAGDAEDQIVVRQGTRYAARMRPIGVAAGAPATFDPNGSYLVSGGLGAIGLALAHWLVERGARHLLLLGRSEPDASRRAAIAALVERGIDVRHERIDVADERALAVLIGALSRAPAPLRGVFHAAGVLDDATLANQSWERFATVMRPKVRGAALLDRLCRELPLDHFVLFSSLSAVVGAPGQANYAAANAYLDGLARARRAAGLPGLSINWGGWAGAGMAGTLDARSRRRAETSGLRMMEPAAALEALGVALLSSPAVRVVADVDWQAMASALDALDRRLLSQAATGGAAFELAGGAALDLSRHGLEQARALLRDRLSAELATVFGFESARDIDPAVGFAEMGMDSLMVVELRARLQRMLGVQLNATTLLDHPTLESLVEYLAVRLTAAAEPPGEPATARARIPSEAAASREPIAIVGAACRFPGGVVDLASYWALLSEGRDGIVEIPRDRFDVDAYYDPKPATPGRMYVRRAGLIADVDRFDAAFFRISPREAETLDPQHRILLELSWEALEHAGALPQELRNSQTGVFVGIGINDYAREVLRADPLGADVYALTGNGFAYAAGRISHALGLRGPSMSLDTACSSSLVAVHEACRSLRQGECDAALAGGVHLMLSPQTLVTICQLQALSPDGTCFTFDERANGYVRGEGAAVVVLKRASDAERDGDRVLGLIRGSAVNHDGPSSGLTVPSGPAQQQLIGAALRDAGVAPAELDYLEAHGTATTLGDPIEVQAAAAATARDRDGSRPLLIGSVKTNFGHLEAAAGIAGLLKTVLAQRHGVIPRHLHFERGNPNIEWDALAVEVVAGARPWPERGRARLAGVSSFGMSGTNAHVVLEGVAERARPSRADGERARTIPLSARTKEALLDQAARLAAHLAPRPELALADVAHTLSAHRTHFAHRTAFAADSIGELRAQLLRLPHAIEDGTARTGHVPPGARPRVVFVFPGHGSQWPGMGRELHASEPVFRESLARCDEAIAIHAGFSVLEALAAAKERSPLDDNHVVQPVIFAVQVALAAQWRAWGIEPDLVIGHSMGELAAAHVSGALALADAARIVCARSRILRAALGRGGMMLVELGLSQATAAIAPYDGRLAVAVNNSPSFSVLSGDLDALEHVRATLDEQGVMTRFVKVDYASHSPQMDALRPELLRALQGIEPGRCAVPMHSTTTNAALVGSELDAAYWARNLREPVRFADAVAAAAGQGCDVFLEVSPHPILVPAIRETLSHAGREGTVVRSLERDRGECRALCETLAELHAAGVDPDWRALCAGDAARVDLPTYAFRRERHWVDPGNTGLPALSPVQPWVGERLRLPGAEIHVRVPVGPRLHPYLQDHRVFGAVVVPGAFHCAIALSVAARELGSQAVVLEGIDFPQVLVLGEREQSLHVMLGPRDGRVLEFELATAWQEERAEGFHTHARGRVRALEAAPRQAGIPALETVRARCAAPLPGAAEYYDRIASVGIELGPTFRWLHELSAPPSGAGNEALALLHRPADLPDAPLLHPTLIDCCLQTVVGTLTELHADSAYVPLGIERLVCHGPARGSRFYCHASRRAGEGAGETLTADLLLYGEQGELLAEVFGLVLKRASRHLLLSLGRDPLQDALYAPAWIEVPAAAAQRLPCAGTYLLLSIAREPCDELASALAAAGARALLLSDAAGAPLDGTDAGALEAALLRAAHECPDVRGAIALATGDAADPGRDPADACIAVTHLLQGLLRTRWPSLPRLWIATESAPVAAGGDVVLGASAAALFGLGRVIGLEHPELRAVRVDLSSGDRGAQAAALAREIALLDADVTGGGTGDEDQLALRAHKRHALRLQRPRLPVAPRLALREDASYLITGGLGGLGLSLARFLVERGARHLTLVGRSAPSAEAERCLQAMGALGAEVQVVSADVAHRAQVEAAVATAQRRAPLRGVFHLAAVLEDAVLMNQTAHGFRHVFAPKVAGALHLDAVTRALPLDHFVLYASAASLTGSPGQGNYAAANAFLDGLAARRRADGLPAVAIDWGAFSDVGLAAASDQRGKRWGLRGVDSMTPEQGLAALERILAASVTQIGVIPLDVRLFAEFFPQVAQLPMFRALLIEAEQAATELAGRGAFRQALLQAPAGERADLLLARLRLLFARVLRVEPARIDPAAPFGSLGIDSLMALELKNHLENDLATPLRVSLLWTYPNLESLAAHLGTLLQLARSDSPVEPVAQPEHDTLEHADADTLADALEAQLGNLA